MPGVSISVSVKEEDFPLYLEKKTELNERARELFYAMLEEFKEKQ